MILIVAHLVDKVCVLCVSVCVCVCVCMCECVFIDYIFFFTGASDLQALASLLASAFPNMFSLNRHEAIYIILNINLFLITLKLLFMSTDSIYYHLCYSIVEIYHAHVNMFICRLYYYTPAYT